MPCVFKSVMRNWLRPSMIVMALLALLASGLPSSAWACPITGSIGSAATVCKGMMPANVTSSDALSQPCARVGGKCCKPVSLPPLQDQSDDEKHPGTAFAPASSAGAALAFLLAHSPTIELAAVLPAAPRRLSPAQTWLARFTNSPPPLRWQHRPASIAGRAPPTL